MMAPRILALDLSLTATGVCSPEGATSLIAPGKLRGVERLAAIVDLELQYLVDLHYPDLVVLEGYSYGSKGRSVFDIGELGGCVRLQLHRWGVPFTTVAPSCLKRFATGKGNCGKDAMIAAAIRRFGFLGETNDEADAYLLWAMASHHYGESFVSVPQAHAAALEAVAWPEMEVIA